MYWPLFWTTIALFLITAIMACLMFKRQRRIDESANKSVLTMKSKPKKRDTIVSTNNDSDDDKSDGENSADL